MRKGMLASVLFVVLLMVSSCAKKGTAGSWTFKGTTYNGAVTIGQANTLSSQSSDGSSILSVTFPGTALPATSATYAVTDSLVPSPGFAFIGMSIGINSYSSTGGNGAQSIAVSVNKGKVSVIGSPITMYATGSDSSALTLNITQ